MSRALLPFLSWFAPFFPSIKDDLEGVDIKKEMELIKQKKSNLPANSRKLVKYRYKKLLEKELD